MNIVQNKVIADIFDEIAAMLSIEETPSSKFEIRAYERAALTIDTLQEPIEEIYQRGGKAALMELPGIGKGLSEKIEEYIKTGKIKKYDELKKKYPIDMKEITKIEGMGAKRAITLYRKIGVKNISDLKKAVAGHKIASLEGFGEKSEELIKKGLKLLDVSKGRILLGDALPVAESIRDRLLRSDLVQKAIVCGSTRRMKETVGDLDILAISNKSEKVMDFFTKLPDVDNTISRGPTKTTVWLKIGISCDIRVVEKENFGAAMQYFTGNLSHNVKMRQIAIKKSLRLNEYGLFDKKNKNVSAGENEEEIYKTLGLDWMEPEMREDRGEIDLALQHKLPRLIRLEDIRGDLQIHANPAGRVTDSLDEMSQSAIKIGREYIGITNHSKSLYAEKGMTDKQLEKFFETIDKTNERLEGKLRILKSAEIDILKDGSLDVSKKTMEQMDYRFAAVHSNLKMNKEEMTERVSKAIDSGYVNILGHPTERLINKREPILMDLDRIFEAAQNNGVVMEIDAQPDRLDLNDENIFKAKEYKLSFSIDTDAHSTAQMYFMRYGIGMAKRGWLKKEDVINTKKVEDLLKHFAK